MTINLLCPASSEGLTEILYKALARSFTKKQVRAATWEDLDSSLLVIANAPDAWGDAICQQLDKNGGKILLLGRIPDSLAKKLRIKTGSLPADIQQHAACAPAATYQYSESIAKIIYRNKIFGHDAPMKQRPCLRYDFTDEWNNLGYGAIRADGSIWALAQTAQFTPEQTLANLCIDDAPYFAYAALVDNGASSLLWFNRPVGPVDSQEWRLVERYFAHYGHPATACVPVLSEIPHGYDAAVTMRLDCDEDIASSKALFDLYNAEQIPFSLALHTKVLEDPSHLPFLREVVASGGSIFTHSATHAVDWGGSYENALKEVTTSRTAILNYIDRDLRCDYAVSPFHQTPDYSVKAMGDGGLHGFIGGIIRNDPAYLIARGGEVPAGADGFISHSQQCMLHGDCMLEGDNPLQFFKQAFVIHQQNAALFGYLDHPFSPRYQYGWTTEGQRVQAHRDFVSFIKKSGKILFLSENQAMDWLRSKAAATVAQDATGKWHISLPDHLKTSFDFTVEYGGKTYAAGAA